MNFLGLRSNQTAAQDPEAQAKSNKVKSAATLEGFIAEDPLAIMSSANDNDGKGEGAGSKNGGFAGLSAKNGIRVADKHINVCEEEGCIVIPCKELPDSWSEEPDMLSFRSLDRPFVFPGEQVHILACLSPSKQDIEIITPFEVIEVKSNNDIDNQNPNDLVEGKIEQNKDVSGESLLIGEDHKRQTEVLLQRFRNSHFFARIAESDEPLWLKRKTEETFRVSTEMIGGNFIADGANKKTPLNTSIDRGNLDASTSGGVARNGVKCRTVANGDIVVLLQVNIGVDFLKDPVLEILQFEKFQEQTLTSGSAETLVCSNHDPCGDLLKWLLPLDNSMSSQPRSLTPPHLSSSSSTRRPSTNVNLQGSNSSQIFSFGHSRSYSMSSIPPSSIPPPSISTSISRPNLELEDWDQFSSRKSWKNDISKVERLLSFRGAPLVPERFSVRCGLEGVYVPGRRWRKKIEIIQPLVIHSFVSDCNTEDIICVQIKNVSPAHAPDIVIYVDAITIIFEEASKGGTPLSLPIACIEAGNDLSLPNLALRKGEEHSFVMKPTMSQWMSVKVHGSSNVDRTASSADKYALLVSCRCNYTESRLFFKQPTSWRPRSSRDLMISVASQMSRQTLGSDDIVPQLPFQVLTLQASNLTPEDLTLMVLAPASFTSSPISPTSPFDASSKVLENQENGHENGARPDPFKEQTMAIDDDVLPRSDLGCSHLWLQSRVPLGCVPSRSTATAKLELLPLTDGIITLDSLQINIKEKGLTYIPEHSVKINANSSINTGII